jgi:hypothetical protein
MINIFLNLRELEKIRESRNKARENKERYEREINKLKYEVNEMGLIGKEFYFISNPIVKRTVTIYRPKVGQTNQNLISRDF